MPDEATNFFHAVIAFGMGLRLLYVEDGVTAHAYLVCTTTTITCTVLLSGLFARATIPWNGTAFAELAR